MSATPTSLEQRRSSTKGQELRIVECHDVQEWDDFVMRHTGTLFHRWAWGAVFDAYRLPVRRLAAMRGERVVGVLPLVRQKSRLFGDNWTSLPWFDAAGVLADEEPAARELVSAANCIRETNGGQTVQLRQISDDGFSANCRTDKVLMRRRLPQTSAQLWESLKAKVRNQIRKAETAGLQVECGGIERVPSFFEVYSRNMRDLGSPSHSQKFFAAVCKTFSSEARVWTVTWNGKVIGAGLTLANGPILEIPWASSLREFNSLCVNHAMYWRILSDACANGYEWFHFGRSTRGSGTYNFKKQWGAEPVPLHWYFLESPASASELAGAANERFGFAQRLWSRLPVFATRHMGPLLIAKLA